MFFMYCSFVVHPRFKYHFFYCFSYFFSLSSMACYYKGFSLSGVHLVSFSIRQREVTITEEIA